MVLTRPKKLPPCRRRQTSMSDTVAFICNKLIAKVSFRTSMGREPIREPILNFAKELSREAQLTAHEQKIIEDDAIVRSEAIRLAKNGLLDQSTYLLADLRKSISDLGTPEKLRLMRESFLLAATAYVQWRRGHPEKAVASLLRADQHDALLERKFGLRLIRVHRLQLLHNKVRLIARTQQSTMFKTCIERAISLRYDVQGNPFDDGKVIEEINSHFVTALLAQLADEFVVAITRYSESENCIDDLGSTMAHFSHDCLGTRSYEFWGELLTHLSGDELHIMTNRMEKLIDCEDVNVTVLYSAATFFTRYLLAIKHREAEAFLLDLSFSGNPFSLKRLA